MTHAEGIRTSVRGINHLALVCSDMARTVAFYEGVLGFPLVKTVQPEGSKLQHFFFDIGGGNQLAFFYFPDGPESVPGVTHPMQQVGPNGPISAVASMNHVAFDVSPEELPAARERLIDAGIECTPIVNHDDSDRTIAKEFHPGVFVQSVYFFDPDGISLELAAWTRTFDESDIRHEPIGLQSAS